jgi:hypothetical protein
LELGPCWVGLAVILISMLRHFVYNKEPEKLFYSTLLGMSENRGFNTMTVSETFPPISSSA